MADIDKYMRMAKKVVIEPEDRSIEDKIIERISSVKESDRELLDGRFMEYLKKNNSRPYLFLESIKNRPGRFIAVLASVFIVLAFIALIFRNSSHPGKKNGENPPDS